MIIKKKFKVELKIYLAIVLTLDHGKRTISDLVRKTEVINLFLAYFAVNLYHTHIAAFLKCFSSSFR